MIRNMRCRRMVAWRVNGTWTTVTSCATQSWCCPFCMTSTLPMPESERSTTKTEVIYHVNDLDATPPEWKTGDVPAVTRTLQYAADIASSRNGQHLSAKSLHRRWKHEIQVALLRRRAAVARAVLANPSARAEWLFASVIDRALHYWGHVPALDGGPGDHDLDDFETDTATPDDDEDIVSLTSCTYESV